MDVKHHETRRDCRPFLINHTVSVGGKHHEKRRECRPFLINHTVSVGGKHHERRTVLQTELEVELAGPLNLDPL